MKFSGCTVHFVDEGTDTGPIIAQAVVPVLEGDDEESLRQRILAEEHRLLPAVVRAIAEGRLARGPPRARRRRVGTTSAPTTLARWSRAARLWARCAPDGSERRGAPTTLRTLE